jgi:hypothetical protein
MRRAKRHVTSLDARAEYDFGEEGNLRETLGDGWTRMWWPRVTKITGLELIKGDAAVLP